jgi:hypothetical protein
MRNSILVLALIATPSLASATVCAYVPFEQQIKTAPIVFVATVTASSSSGPFSVLKDGSNYRVIYSFEVRDRIKGDPSSVSSLFTNNTYKAYGSAISWDSPETRLLPGDNVLVIADAPGDIQVAACTGSRLWDPTPEQLKAIRSLAGAPPNRSFKPNPPRNAIAPDGSALISASDTTRGGSA